MNFENKFPDKMMEFIGRNDVTEDRLEAEVKIDTHEILSDLKRMSTP